MKYSIVYKINLSLSPIFNCYKLPQPTNYYLLPDDMAYFTCPRIQMNKKTRNVLLLCLAATFMCHILAGKGGAIPTRIKYIAKLDKLAETKCPDNNLHSLCQCAEQRSSQRATIRKQAQKNAQPIIRAYSKYVQRGEPKSEFYFNKYALKQNCTAMDGSCQFTVCKAVADGAVKHRNTIDLILSWASKN